MLLADREAEDAHLLETLDDLRGVLVLVLELGGDGEHLIVDEPPHGREDLALVVGQTLGALQAAHDVEYRARAARGGEGPPCDRRHRGRRLESLPGPAVAVTARRDTSRRLRPPPGGRGPVRARVAAVVVASAG